MSCNDFVILSGIGSENSINCGDCMGKIWICRDVFLSTQNWRLRTTFRDSVRMHFISSVRSSQLECTPKIDCARFLVSLKTRAWIYIYDSFIFAKELPEKYWRRLTNILLLHNGFNYKKNGCIAAASSVDAQWCLWWKNGLIQIKWVPDPSYIGNGLPITHKQLNFLKRSILFVGRCTL